MTRRTDPGQAAGHMANFVRSPGGIIIPALAAGAWKIIARDPLGRILHKGKFYDELEIDIENIVVNAGLDYLLDIGLSGGTQITSWYLGLTDGTPTVAAADTPSSHAGWTEVTAYSEGTRQAWTDGGVSSQSVDNSGSPATFTISSDSTTIGGAFLTSLSTKGGTTGTLYAAGAFTSGDVVLNTGATLDVTATFTEAAA